MISSERKPRAPTMSGSTDLSHARAPFARPPAVALGAVIALVAVLLAVPAVPGAFAVSSAGGTPAAQHVTSPVRLADGAIPSGALASHLDAARLLQPVTAQRAALPGAGTAGVPASPTPLLSTANSAVTGSDCATFGIYTPFEPIPYASSSILAVPGSNTTLLAAGGSSQGVFNTSGGTLCNAIASPSPYFGSHGATALYRSTDAGASWSTTWLGQNVTDWQNTSNPTNGSVNWGQPTLAATSGGTVLVSEMGLPNCWFNFTNYPANLCHDNATYLVPWSIAVARSTNNGLTWGAPAQIASAQAVKWVNVTSSCSSVFTSGSGLYYGTIPEHPSLAVNPSNGVAVVAWSEWSLTFDMSTCTVAQSGTTLVSVSTNNGLTWSSPTTVATGFELYPSVTIGPGPTYPIDVYYNDVQNSTSSATSWGLVVSTDNGTTWGTPHPISLYAVNVVAGFGGSPFVQPETFVGLQPPAAAVDTGASSSYRGASYVVWSDNQTGSSAGTPAIDVMVKGATASSWSNPVTISSGSQYFFQPSVSVGPTGEVFISYYGYAPSSASYQVYGVFSLDGGTTWSHQFRITDVASTPASGWADMGVWSGSTVTTNGAYAIWTDCRSSVCASSYDDVLETANPHAVTISANIPGVNASVTTFSSTQTYSLPATVGWDNSTTSSVSIPQYLPDTSNPADVYTFQNFSGITSSTSYSATVTYTGQTGSLLVNYKAVPAAILRGTITPIVSGTSVTVNGLPVALTPYNATAVQYLTSVPGGLSYTIAISAPNYQSQTQSVQTGPGGTYYWNVTLKKSPGYFVGQLTPSTANLTVNGTAVTTVNAATGLYNVSEPFGWYWINASGKGLTAFSEYLQVSAGHATTVNIALIGGWIQGVVLGAQPTKPGLMVELDGTPIPVSTAGTFNNSTLGGFHTITATQSGYNLTTMSVFVTPGATTLVNVSLTNRGWISGLIQPAGAVQTAILHIYSGTTGSYYQVAANGTFNVSLVGNVAYTVNVSATGYQSYQSSVTVTPGNGSQLSISLTPVSNPCPTGNCGTQPGNSTPSNNGISTTTLIIIVVAIIAVVAVALVVLLTRRRGGGGETVYSEPQPVYQDTSPSTLPRLQQDGSMGPGNPPPPQ